MKVDSLTRTAKTRSAMATRSLAADSVPAHLESLGRARFRDDSRRMAASVPPGGLHRAYYRNAGWCRIPLADWASELQPAQSAARFDDSVLRG
jgi:hypothetical protein